MADPGSSPIQCPYLPALRKRDAQAQRRRLTRTEDARRIREAERYAGNEAPTRGGARGTCGVNRRFEANCNTSAGAASDGALYRGTEVCVE